MIELMWISEATDQSTRVGLYPTIPKLLARLQNDVNLLLTSLYGVDWQSLMRASIDDESPDDIFDGVFAFHVPEGLCCDDKALLLEDPRLRHMHHEGDGCYVFCLSRLDWLASPQFGRSLYFTR